jgi:hypothetical protein
LEPATISPAFSLMSGFDILARLRHNGRVPKPES